MDLDSEDAVRYPREPNGPSADCPSCDVYGRVSVDYSTMGARGDHDLNKFVVARCGNCGEKLGRYKLSQTEDPLPRD